MFCLRRNFANKKFSLKNSSKWVSYVQGQSPEPKIREYFYFINHEGMLFLDDARIKNFTSCFKDKKFIEFFFNRLKVNDLNRFKEDFPYLSPCGRERNFIRCDDVPIVFTHIIKDAQGNEFLSHNHAADLLKVKFEPNKIFMSPSGKVYHPASARHGNIGLIGSKLSIEISNLFQFPPNSTQDAVAPIAIKWNEKIHEIDAKWIENAYCPNDDLLN